MALTGTVTASAGVVGLGHVRSHQAWLLEQIGSGVSVIAWSGGMWLGLDGDPEGFIDLVLEQGTVSLVVFNLDELRSRVEGGRTGLGSRSAFDLAAS